MCVSFFNLIRLLIRGVSRQVLPSTAKEKGVCIAYYRRRRMITTPKRNFMSPLQSVGTVLTNGRISTTLVSAACANKNPYHPLNGKARAQLDIVKRGELVYRYHTRESSIDCLVVDPLYARRENAVIKGLTVINGQGDASQTNEDIARSIQVMGIAEMSNEANNKDVYNIITGGIHDVRNNGDETINVGDHVMWHYPSLAETGKGGGNLQTADEKNGVVTLWYKPYRPELHKSQPKQMLACLNDTQNARPYLAEYRRHCQQFVNSAAGMAMVMLAQQLDDLRADLNNATLTSADILHAFLTRAGHSEFKSLEPSMAAAANMIAARRAATRDALFVPFSTDSRNATPYLFTPSAMNSAPKREQEKRRKLNDIQSSSTSLFLESSAALVHTITDRVIGIAKSTALPGYDFSLELSGYSKK